MDFRYTPEQEAFRREVREWMKVNIPGDFGSPEWPAPKDYDGQVKLMRDWARTLRGSCRSPPCRD